MAKKKRTLRQVGRFQFIHFASLIVLAVGVVFVSYSYQEQNKVGLGSSRKMEKFVITKMYRIVEERNAMMQRAGLMLLKDTNNNLGSILTDQRGMTLYTYKDDEPGKSNCYDNCVFMWPTLWAKGTIAFGEGLDGDLNIIEREDGPGQVTYNNQPLYFYREDKTAGDTNGHGVSGKWEVARP